MTRVAAKEVRLPVGHRLLSALEAEKLLGIPRATVRSWQRRHRATGLFPAAIDRRGVPLFREIDLLDLRHGRKIRDADGERIRP